MLLISGVDVASKIAAIKPVSSVLGGLNIPNDNELKLIRLPSILSKTFSKVCKKARTQGTCTALFVQVTDVELMRNPGMRPGSVAHSFVMTVSPAGVFILQAYGPLGYTLLQYMRSHSDSFPLSFDDGDAWVKNFDLFAADLGGVWTEEVNSAYKCCFEVDLVKPGCMRIGSQLDVYVRISSHEFDAGLVQRNLNLLPKRRSAGRKVPCRDGAAATANRPPPRYKPDGGVKHYYVSVILCCGLCGKKQGKKEHKRCTKCKAVHYCCREHQVEDWPRHKKMCKAIVTRRKAGRA